MRDLIVFRGLNMDELINRGIVLAFAVISIGIFSLVVSCIIKCYNIGYNDHDYESSDDQHVTITIKELASINPSILRSIPVVDFNTQGFKDGIQCVVCLSELADGDKATVLPTCNHWFHAHCIDSWFQSHSTCPVCRNIVGLAKNHYSGFEPDESLTNSLPTTNTAVIEDSDETNEFQPDQICSRCGRHSY